MARGVRPVVLPVENVDVLIVGGGFFGLYVADHLRKRFSRVTVCEASDSLMGKASLRNQSRIHNGYHYARSILTGMRCRVNLRRFVEEFREAVVDRDASHYAIARIGSHVSARQFELFCERIGASLEPAESAVRELFDPDLIESVYRTEELIFDSSMLRQTMEQRLLRAGIDVRLRSEVCRVEPASSGRLRVTVKSPGGMQVIEAGQVLHCTYSSLNEVMASSGLPLVALKHELAEMALVEVPAPLDALSITVMCGPFFSVMRFPSRGLFTLSHVRYTPHCEWHDRPETFEPTRDVFQTLQKKTNFPHMIRDASRYVPILAECRYAESLWEVKTVLPMTEADDSRPILFLKHHGLPNHHLILGAKIDNVYDVVTELDQLFAAQ
jgi:glycine/D-amino acid oxidase-like deaminating enzyme